MLCRAVTLVLAMGRRVAGVDRHVAVCDLTHVRSFLAIYAEIGVYADVEAANLVDGDVQHVNGRDEHNKQNQYTKPENRTMSDEPSWTRVESSACFERAREHRSLSHTL